MRTITNKNMKVLIAQRDESKLLGLNKIASNLTNQISVNPVRNDSEGYVYNYEELKNDVESILWDAAIRAQDFYAKFSDARDIQDLIEKHAEDFINSIRVKSAAKIGAYEQPLAGEARDNIIIEVNE